MNIEDIELDEPRGDEVILRVVSAGNPKAFRQAIDGVALRGSVIKAVMRP